MFELYYLYLKFDDLTREHAVYRVNTLKLFRRSLLELYLDNRSITSCESTIS